jgi:hypothetical protein
MVSEKTCSKCGEIKPRTEFHKAKQAADGLRSHCKDCRKEYYRLTFKAKQAYDKQRNQTPEQKAANARHIRNHRARHPLQAKAWNAVSNAIQAGRLIRQPCEVCGKKSQAHHDDYAKPLEVRWLCCEHHRIVHGQLGYRS